MGVPVTRDEASGLWKQGNVFHVKRPRARPEDDFHASLKKFCDYALPPDAWLVSWESRGAGVREGARRKARGVRQGWPDCGVHWRQTVIYFELKAPRGGSVSVEQRQCHERLRLMGFKVYVIRTIEAFADALTDCGMELRARV